MEPIKIDLNAKLTLNKGECAQCYGTGIYVGKTSGGESSCPFCWGKGQEEDSITVAELFEAFRQMLRTEGI